MRSSGCRTPTAARPLRASIAPGSPAGCSPTLSVASCRARLPSRVRWASGSRWMSWYPATFCSGDRARASIMWASTPATASTSTPPRAAAASCAPPSIISLPTSPSASSSKDDSAYQRKRPSGRGYSKTIFVAFARMPCEFCDKMPVQKRWRHLTCQMIC